MPPAVFIFLTICGAALRAKEVWVRSVVRGRGNIAGRGRGKVSVVERQKRYRLSTVGEPGRAIKACHGNRRKAIKLAITNMTIDNWYGYDVHYPNDRPGYDPPCHLTVYHLSYKCICTWLAGLLLDGSDIRLPRDDLWIWPLFNLLVYLCIEMSRR